MNEQSTINYKFLIMYVTNKLLLIVLRLIFDILILAGIFLNFSRNFPINFLKFFLVFSIFLH